MNLFEKLPQYERDMIEYYMIQYGYTSRDKNYHDDRAPLSHILRCWDKNKEALYQMFGEQFIIERPIEFAMNQQEIMQEMHEEFLDRSSSFYLFRSQLRDLVLEGENQPLRYAYGEIAYLLNSVIDDMVVMSENKYTGATFVIPLPDGKKVKFTNGVKPMRLLGKIAKAYGLDSFEDFRIRHSQFLNQKFIKGTMCLSIHPLDFMTMSDNNSDWSSCMSWIDEGCYRSGTIECMNSEHVVVAYIKSDDEGMDLGGGWDWNNKKWRSLFLVDNRVMTSVKGYPYRNNDFNEFVLNWLKELTDRPYSTPQIYQYSHGITFVDKELPHIRLYFQASGHMYNDFGSDLHMGVFNFESFAPDEYYEVDYSGESVCIHCGAINCMPEDETELCCCDCCSERICDCCGEYINYEDDAYTLGDHTLCRDCYEEYVEYDPFYGEDGYRPDMHQVYMIPEGTVFDSAKTYKYIKVYTQSYNGRGYGILNPTLTFRDATELWETNYYIYPSDLTERGWEIFENKMREEGYEDLEKYTIEVNK